jgi:GR25 family glycosyltransferase involved in LPS biosynthesis
LNNTFNKLKIDTDYYEFVVNTHKDTLSDELLSQYYTTDTDIRHKELSIIGEQKYLTKEVSKGNISCGINHLLIWKKIIESQFNNVLVLEDDIVFLEHTINNLVELTMQLPKDFNIISLEDGAGLTVSNYITKNITPDKVVYKAPDGRMRCTGAYIINKRTCEKLIALNLKRKFSLEIDMQLWLYGNLDLLNIYWAEPHVFTQGSQRGIYKSHIQPDKASNSNTDDKTLVSYPIEFYKKIDSLPHMLYKRCISLCEHDHTNIAVNKLISEHHFSALIVHSGASNPIFPFDPSKFPVKTIRITADTSYVDIAKHVKNNLFHGDVDVLSLRYDNLECLYALLVEYVVVNPKFIIFNADTPVDKPWFDSRYKRLIEHSNLVYARVN